VERINRPVYSIYRFIWQSLDWLYPPRCGGCESAGTRWCSKCQASVILVKDRICPRCGNLQLHDHLCSDCSQKLPAYSKLRSWGVFDGQLREAIHRLKYQQDIALGDVFAQFLLSFLQDLQWKVDIIVPVPLSKMRLKDRGYNQSALLARPVALALGKPYRPGALERWRNTPSQVGPSKVERTFNVEGAFKAVDDLVQGKIVLLIDDVTTTGATIQASTISLMQAGAQEVLGLTLARAVIKA
jgi:ComF family protein